MTEEPRQRDADRSRAHILDAAERLFAEHGYDAVTMADIGAGAGVSRGTPGYFFGAKSALYGEVLRRAAATFSMFGETLKVRAAAAERTGDDLIADTARSFVELLRARPDAVRLLDRDSGDLGHPQVDALRNALDGLGAEADGVAYRILAITWFAAAHPDLATALGVDLADADAVVAMVGGAGATAPSTEATDRAAKRQAIADTDEAAAIVVALKKKKKKKGKKKKA